MLLCLKCYVDKEDNLMCHASFNVYALYCLHLSHHQLSGLSKPCLPKLCTKHNSACTSIPETNIFHLSPPYLPIRVIPLPLLKYIIYVLSLDVQNLLFCASDSAHEEVVGNP